MKRYTSRFLVALLAFTFVLSPAISSAATEAELNASIVSVQTQIQSLQTQLSSFQAQLYALRQNPSSQKSLPDAFVGVLYRQRIRNAQNSGQNQSFVTSGSLPPGLSIIPESQCSSGNCEDNSVYITGTPTKEGTYSFRLRSREGRSDRSSETVYSIKVSASTTPPVVVATSTLALMSAYAPLRSQNYRNNGVDTLSGVVLSTFNLRSDTGDSKLTAVNTTVAGTGTLPTTLSLYNGTTLLKSKAVPSSGIVSLDGLSLVISKGAPVTLTIKADFPSSTANGSSANLVVMSANYQSANGINLVTTAAPVVSASQYVFDAVAQFSLASTPTIAAMTDSNGRTTSVTASFNMNVQAIGGNVRMPLPADFGVKLAAPGGQKYPSTNVGVTVIPNVDIADGSTGSVTVTARWGSSTLAVAGPYLAAIDSIQWTIGSATVTQTYGLEDFKTPNAVNVVATVPQYKTSFMSQAAGVWSAFLSLFAN